jgi:hypothetical protein
MKQINTFIVAILLFSGLTFTANAMPPGQMKKILNMTQNSWVSFRDFNGKQLIYFTHLEAYTCGIKEVHYSLNSDELDKIWELQPCAGKGISDIKKEMIYLTLPLGTAKSIAVQLEFTDGMKSDILYKEP